MNKYVKIALVVALIGGIVVTVTASPLMPWNEKGEWGFPLGEKEEETIIDDDQPSVYNEQKDWEDVPIKIGVKNDYPYNHPAIAGIAVEIRDADGYVDSGTTGTAGTWTSTVETFDSRDTYTLIIGAIATTNKSQEYSFIIQGQDGDSKPSYIYCGSFMYKPVVEEANIAFAFYNEEFASLSAINLTTATYVADHIVEGYVKITFSASSYGFGRTMFSSTKGDVEAYIAFIFTEYNSTNSNAIRGQATDGYKGTGGGTGAHHVVCQIQEISYQVTEDGDTIDPNKAVHWFYFKFDFSGCGIPTTYTAATALRMTLSGVVSFEYDWTVFASGGAAYSSTWFSDTDLTAIDITT